jgi:hypothetical protein
MESPYLHFPSRHPVLCQRGDRTKWLYVSAVIVQRHRPSHVVEEEPTRVPTLDPDDQSVPGCAYQLCVSLETF